MPWISWSCVWKLHKSGRGHLPSRGRDELGNKVLSEEFKLLSWNESRETAPGCPQESRPQDRFGRREYLGQLIDSNGQIRNQCAQALRVHSDSHEDKEVSTGRRKWRQSFLLSCCSVDSLFLPSLFVILLGPRVIQIIRILLPRLPGH